MDEEQELYFEEEGDTESVQQKPSPFRTPQTQAQPGISEWLKRFKSSKTAPKPAPQPTQGEGQLKTLTRLKTTQLTPEQQAMEGVQSGIATSQDPRLNRFNVQREQQRSYLQILQGGSGRYGHTIPLEEDRTPEGQRETLSLSADADLAEARQTGNLGAYLDYGIKKFASQGAVPSFVTRTGLATANAATLGFLNEAMTTEGDFGERIDPNTVGQLNQISTGSQAADLTADIAGMSAGMLMAFRPIVSNVQATGVRPDLVLPISASTHSALSNVAQNNFTPEAALDVVASGASGAGQNLVNRYGATVAQQSKSSAARLLKAWGIPIGGGAYINLSELEARNAITGRETTDDERITALATGIGFGLNDANAINKASKTLKNVRGSNLIDNLIPEAQAVANEVHTAFQELGKNYRITSGRRKGDGSSQHHSGNAIDIVSGNREQMVAHAKVLQELGFKAEFEKKGQKNPNGSIATGDHIHITLDPRRITATPEVQQDPSIDPIAEEFTQVNESLTQPTGVRPPEEVLSSEPETSFPDVYDVVRVAMPDGTQSEPLTIQSVERIESSEPMYRLPGFEEFVPASRLTLEYQNPDESIDRSTGGAGRPEVAGEAGLRDVDEFVQPEPVGSDAGVRPDRQDRPVQTEGQILSGEPSARDLQVRDGEVPVAEDSGTGSSILGRTEGTPPEGLPDTRASIEQEVLPRNDGSSESSSQLASRVFAVDPNELKVDPKRFQFKQNADTEGVVKDNLEIRKWNPDLAGVIHVWRDPEDNDLYVVNGHHRTAKAKALGAESVEVRLIEADDAIEARTKGALINIAEGHGTAIDAAKVIRSNSYTPEQFESFGISLKGKLATDGMALSKLHSSIFDKVVHGEIKQNIGTMIGETLADPSLQREAVKQFESLKPRQQTEAMAREIVDEIRFSPTEVVQEESLFGTDARTETLATDKRAIKADIRNQLATDKRLFGRVAKDKVASQLERGGNKINVEESKRIAETSAKYLEVFDALKNTTEFGDIFNRSVKSLRAPNADKPSIKRRAYAEVVDKINEQFKIEENRQSVDAARPAPTLDDQLFDMPAGIRDIQLAKNESDELRALLDPDSTIVDMADFVVGPREVFDELSKKSQDLERRQAKAKANEPFQAITERDKPIKRGAEALINRLALQRSKSEGEGLTLDIEDTIRDFMRRVGYHMFDDVGLSIRAKGGAQGHFDFANNVVTLFEKSILKSQEFSELGGVGRMSNYEHVAVHELWHSLSRYLPDKDVEAVRRDFINAKKKFSKKNPWFAALSQGDELVDRMSMETFKDYEKAFPEAAKNRWGDTKDYNGKVIGKRLIYSTETYRFKNLDEFFAETLAELSLKTDPYYSTKTKKIIGFAKKIVGGMIDAVKRMLGYQRAQKFALDMFKGRYEDAKIVRQLPLHYTAGDALVSMDMAEFRGFEVFKKLYEQNPDEARRRAPNFAARYEKEFLAKPGSDAQSNLRKNLTANAPMDSGTLSMSVFGVAPRQTKAKSKGDAQKQFTASKPEIHERLIAASRPIEPSRWELYAAKAKRAWHIASREFADLPRTARFADFRQSLKKTLKAYEIAQSEVAFDLRGLVASLNRDQQSNLRWKIIYDNMAENVRVQEQNGDTPILPFGYGNDIATFRNDHENINKIVADDEELTKAASDYYGYVQQRAGDYMDAHERVFGTRPNLTRENYFHQRVLKYAEEAPASSGGIGAGMLSRGWTKERTANELDFSTSFWDTMPRVFVEILNDTKRLEFYEKVKTEESDPTKSKAVAEAAAFKAANNIDIDWRAFVPEGYMEWKPKAQNTLTPLDKIPEKIAAAIEEYKLELLKLGYEDQAALRTADEKYTLVVPQEIALTLDNLGADTKFKRVLAKPLKYWKWNALFNPLRVVKYITRNALGDLSKTVFNVNGLGKPLIKALNDVDDVFRLKKAPDTEFAQWMQRGGLASTFNAMEDVDVRNDLQALKNQFVNREIGYNPIDWLKRVGSGYKSGAAKVNDARESIHRYANYLSYLEQMQADMANGGEGKPKNFGASDPEQIMAIKDVRDRAYALSNELLGAYDNVSVAGQFLAKYMYPFFRYKEANFRTYLGLWKNTWREIKKDPSLEKIGSQFIKHSPILAYRAAKFYALANATQAIAQVFNEYVNGDEEKKLPEEIRKGSHITLGKDAHGNVLYFNRISGFEDLTEMGGVTDINYELQQVLMGRKTVDDAVKSLSEHPDKTLEKMWKPIVNNWMQGFGPQQTAVELIAGKKFFPDVTNPRAIRDKWEHLFSSVGVGNVYKHLAGKPSEGEFKFVKDLFLYSIDPRESAFNEIRSKAYDFKKEKTGSSADFTPDNKANAAYYMKQALKYGDLTAAKKYLLEYVKYSVGDHVKTLDQKMKGEDRDTLEESLNRSIRSLDPLSTLNEEQRSEFLRGLSQDERMQVVQAQEWLNEMVNLSEEQLQVHYSVRRALHDAYEGVREKQKTDKRVLRR